jgi:hypothetical protein
VVLDGATVPAPHIHECGVTIMDESWNYRGVCSPFWRAYYNPDPGASVRSGGRYLPLRPDQVLVLPEEARYDCIPQAGARHLWIHFSLEGGRTAYPCGRRREHRIKWAV